MKMIITAVRNLVVMTLILGVLYPLSIFFVGKIFFSAKSGGSLVSSDGKVQGSLLIAQKFESERYFHSRPSAVDYTSQSSGASQKSGTSRELKDRVVALQNQNKDTPSDLLYASGSGLDPHISPEAAKFQKPRIQAARQLSEDQIDKLIASATEDRFLGFMGQPRVNVLKLNLSLDQ